MHPDKNEIDPNLLYPDVLTTSVPEGLPGITEGRMCHYVAYNNRHLAAIVIGYDRSKSYDKVDLAIFTNMQNVNGDKSFGIQFHQDVKHSEGKEPGTWHWLEKA